MPTTARKRVLLTGVSRGLGRALALELAAAGHTIFGCARSQPGLDSLAAALAGGADRANRAGRAAAEDHRLMAVDVTDAAAVEAWAAEMLAAGPAPDLIVNNAALINEPAPLWEVSAAEMASLVAVNILGVHHVIRSFVPAMIERGEGVIVNLSSGWGRSTSADVGPYCTTKWAIEGLTGSLADDLPRGLAAVSLNPGVIDTDMLRTAWSEGAASFERPERWAKRAAPFLLGLTARNNGDRATVPGG